MEKPQKKILILYTAVGQGHKSIAENIGYYLEQAGFTVKLDDAYKAQDGKLIRGGAVVHRFMNFQAPWLWRFFYNSKLFTNLSLRFRTKVAGKNYRKVLEIIERFNPDLIISTQTSPSAIVAFLKQAGLYQNLFAIAFSDFHLHRYWLYKEADFYLANIEQQKQDMIALGISADKIAVCGMILKPKILVDTRAIKKKFGIGPNDKVALIASGSQGTGLDENLIWQFLGSPGVKVIVVCGKNKSAFLSLSEKFVGDPITILSFYSPMEELYAIADIFITKPGGLSMAEALRFGLPILISHTLPGQEELNYDYLQEAGLVMPEPINLVSAALEELQTGNFKQALAGNAELNKLFNMEEPLIISVNNLLGRQGVLANKDVVTSSQKPQNDAVS